MSPVHSLVQCGTIAVFLFSNILASQADRTLTNQDIIQMMRAKLPNRIILKSVESSTSVKFDTSPEALIELKNAGADDELIEAILDISKPRRGSEKIGATVNSPEKSDLLNSRDADTILRTFRTMYVDAKDAQFFNSARMQGALGQNREFLTFGISLVDNLAVADTVLRVGYVFAWDYPFSLTHQNTRLVLLSGKGHGPFSGPVGAESVAKELTKLLKRYRGTPREQPPAEPAK